MFPHYFYSPAHQLTSSPAHQLTSSPAHFLIAEFLVDPRLPYFVLVLLLIPITLNI